MCLATPLKLKKIKGDIATVKHDGRDYNVSLQLIPKAKVGDWLLAHGEIGISIIRESEARDILSMIHKLNSTP